VTFLVQYFFTPLDTLVVKTLEGELYIVITAYCVAFVIIILRICTIPTYRVYQLYDSSRSSLADCALVESSNCKVFYNQQGHCERRTECLPHTQSQDDVHGLCNLQLF